MNRVFVSGRLTRDPELRHTQSDTAVVNCGIAVEEYRKEGENKTSFFDLVIWSGFGELVAKKARKGDSVTVEGRLNQNTWENDEGQKRSKVEIIVGQMEGDFLYRKADGSDTPERSDGEQQQIAGDGAAAASDDDIPF